MKTYVINKTPRICSKKCTDGRLVARENADSVSEPSQPRAKDSTPGQTLTVMTGSGRGKMKHRQSHTSKTTASTKAKLGPDTNINITKIVKIYYPPPTPTEFGKLDRDETRRTRKTQPGRKAQNGNLTKTTLPT